jgi:hypothetical protein
MILEVNMGKNEKELILNIPKQNNCLAYIFKGKGFFG